MRFSARQIRSFANIVALKICRGRFASQTPARSGALRKTGNMRRSMRVGLTVAFMGLAIGPVLLVGVVLVWRSYTMQQQQALYLVTIHGMSMRGYAAMCDRV